MAVRSKTLAAASATTVLTALYTVPAGHTTIVKNVIVSKFGTPAQTLTLTILRGAFASGLVLDAHGIGASVDSHSVYAILQPGDVIRAITDSGTIGVWISGVELLGVAP